MVVFLSIRAQTAHAQWMVGAYIGWAAPFKTNVRIDSPADGTAVGLDQLDFKTRSFQNPLYYGLRAGLMLSPRFGAELEMTHLKIYADVDTPVTATGTLRGAPVTGILTPRSVVEQLNVSHGLNMVLGNFVTRFPLGGDAASENRAVVTARFGIGPTLSHTEATVLGMTAEHYEPGGIAMQAAGGLEIPIGGNFYLLGEYKYTYTRQHLSVGTATVHLSPATQHLVTGIAYHFQ